MLGKVVMIRIAWNLKLLQQFLFISVHVTCEKGNKGNLDFIDSWSCPHDKHVIHIVGLERELDVKPFWI